jgi:hypothetical protein
MSCFVGGPSAIAKSPSDNDQTELLKNAEPVDYTGQNVDTFSDLSSRNFDIGHTDTSGRYQTQTRSTQSGRFGTKQTGPPRDIFDDV